MDFRINKFISLVCMLIFIAANKCSFAAQWVSLKDGDIIEVIAPSYGATANLEKVSSNIQSMGFFARTSPDLIRTQYPFDSSNTEEYRREHFKAALSSLDSKVIWALRGGRDGTALFSEDWEWFLNFRTDLVKLCIGFSDFTVVHLYVNNVLNWPSLHWCVLAYNKDANPAVNADTTLEKCTPILKGEVTELSYTLLPVNDAARITRIINDTVIIGGNASLVQRNIGTQCCPKTADWAFTDNKIFFLEDIGEPVSKLKEIFRHFKRSGLLKNPKAIFLGNFRVDSKEEAQYVQFKIWLSSQMKDLIPIYESDNFGHGAINSPLFFNTPSEISTSSDGISTLKNSINN